MYALPRLLYIHMIGLTQSQQTKIHYNIVIIRIPIGSAFKTL